jgi:hypothetical protein
LCSPSCGWLSSSLAAVVLAITQVVLAGVVEVHLDRLIAVLLAGVALAGVAVAAIASLAQVPVRLALIAEASVVAILVVGEPALTGDK